MAALKPLLRSTPFLLNTHRRITVMPLRAKILPIQGRNYAEMSADASLANSPEGIRKLIDDLPDEDPDDVLFSSNFGLRVMEMNRPKKLNSLNGSMAKKIIQRMQEWEKSDMAQILLLKGAGRALCAGGDVAALANWNKDGDWQKSANYFAVEYNLDHLIASYSKPYVAYMDGITMGGGVGLSVHAPFRIATENTVFAMPETTIGFFPEVGATFFLPRMDGELGMYLALTSEQLRGVDTFYHGVASHYIHSTSLNELSDRLSQLQFSDGASLQERHSLINQAISEYDTGLETPAPKITGAIRKHIDHCFSAHSPIDILKELAQVGKQDSDAEVQKWAAKTIATIRERSPIGVSVTFRALRQGGKWSIAQAFQNEHAIASEFMRHPDFVTGVYARLIDRIKTRPNWSPSTLEDVKEEDVDAFFKETNSSTPLVLLHTGPGGKYKEYPHAWTSLPTDKKVLQQIKESGSAESALKDLLKQSGDKVGVKEKVDEVASRLRI